MTFEEVAVEIAKELIRKSGVRDYESAESRTAIANAAVEMAAILFGDEAVALPDYMKLGRGTALVIKSSGGDAAITLASLANSNGTSTGARQSGTIDLGALWDQDWLIETEMEKAATPTAGTFDPIFASFHSSTGAGFGGTSGSDASYTGYSNNNLVAAQAHLVLIGGHHNTTQATATVQKDCNAGRFSPRGRYMNLVYFNQGGSAIHSSDTNCLIRLIPLQFSIQD